MTKDTLEHLSCLMDGELSADAGRFLVRRAASDESLGETWQRYHLIRDCLRRPGESMTLATLSIDMDKLDDAPDPGLAAPVRQSPAWLRPVAGSAIAASVAAVAIAVTLNLNPAAMPSATEPFASPNSAGIAPVSQPASFQTGSAVNQQSLNRYLLRHNQAAGAVGQQGFVSFVPIVATAPVQLKGEPQAERGAAASDNASSDGAENVAERQSAEGEQP